MCLHDFLTRSFELLTLLAEVEQRQAAITSHLADLEAYCSEDPDRGSVLARLEADCRKTAAELDRALSLLSGF